MTTVIVDYTFKMCF